MNTPSLEKLEKDVEKFTVAIRPFFPTMAGVVSLGSHTSQQMKMVNRERRIVALQRRMAKQRQQSNG